MLRVIHPSPVEGIFEIPPSKSHTMRALLFASIAQGTSRIHTPLMGSDTQKMLDACRKIGADF